jgi:hypothetical protein
MPDAKEMSGIPRPVDDLPDGTISIRVIRGELSKNIANQPVELHVGSKVMKATTDESGRAQFTGVTPGESVTASTDVDGEHLESPGFPAPSKGGIRMMLVATDPSKPAASPDAPAIKGEVVLSTQSRIVMEPGDEAVGVYYLLDISNTAKVPVDPPTLFMFDMPKESIGTTIMDGSSKLASNVGTRVRVQGPFPPGHTVVQVAAELPAGSGDLDIAAKFPAKMEQLAVVLKKVGEATLSSPQIARQQEFPVDGGTYIAGTGGSIPAGQEIRIQVTGLPHHSGAPRIIALALASFIVLAGAWAWKQPDDEGTMRAAERKRLLTRREKLFNDLVRLENDRRQGRVDERRHATRRDELMASLENVYGALDDDHGPEPAAGPGLAASVARAV